VKNRTQSSDSRGDFNDETSAKLSPPETEQGCGRVGFGGKPWSGISLGASGSPMKYETGDRPHGPAALPDRHNLVIEHRAQLELRPIPAHCYRQFPARHQGLSAMPADVARKLHSHL
jgi:hypothetical protein